MSNDSRKLRPRFLRFNLRTLIVVTTVICICLGVIAIRAQNKRQAIADEKRADELVGILYWGRKDASSKIDDSSLALISRFPQLKVDRLFLGNTQVTDAGLVHLKGMTKLRELALNNTEVTDAGLENLKGMTKLRLLELNNTQVTDAGLEHLKGIKVDK